MMWAMRFLTENQDVLLDDDFENSAEHAALTNRLKKTLYYGRMPKNDRPSLPVTEVAVEFFQEAAPRELGKVDAYVASNYARQACVSPCSLMLGMIYIDRLRHKNPEYLQKVSSSDLFLISMLVSSKYLYDEGVDEEVFNDEWAESAKIDMAEMNELERNFLSAIDWDLYVRSHDFWKVLGDIERRIAFEKGRQRDFFTYTDALVLTDDGCLFDNFRRLVLGVCKVLAVCSVAYVAGVLTMVGATLSVNYLKNNAPLLPKLHTGTDLLPNFQNDSDLISSILTPSSIGQPLSEIQQPLITSRPLSEIQQPLNSTQPLSDTQPLSHPLSFLGASHFYSSNTLLDTQNESKTSAMMTDDEGPNNAYDSRRSTSRKKGLHIPGLLTLAIIKDTLIQFASGFRDKLSPHDQLSKDTNKNDRVPHICTCGCCDVRQNEQNCRNVSRGYNDSEFGDNMGSWQCFDGLRHACQGADVGRGAWQCCCYGDRAAGSFLVQEELTWIQPPLHVVPLSFSTAPLVAS